MDNIEIKPEYPQQTINQPIFYSDIKKIPFFQSVTAIPTAAPRNLSEQIVILTSGGTVKLYAYDTASAAWKAVTIT